MTHETPSGKLVMRKAHRRQLTTRVETTMDLYTKGRQKVCTDLVLQCCQLADLITIYDINSGEPMDKYILFALLKGDGLASESSRLDQLHLSLLWNRPDIAESHIFPGILCSLQYSFLLGTGCKFFDQPI
ncbi:transient receptor potential cation channel subfamily M member 4-like [Hyalella azteca]|uniref:Transient receptor potential cation channel subfamily M member 4-like n=1 Tax=Hyalella azteca TaxID=294128 RepID=A0A979FU49_HYAAZ|nr:transient receptor potential cation channel subfamily M member 4-like [Hyalella azteca]